MNKFISAALLIALTAITFTACGVKEETAAQEQKPAYQKITAQEGKEMIDGGDIILVDVRTKEEYDSGHIANAILIPNETISDKMPEELDNLDAKIIIYCRSGRRSAIAAKNLIKMGYTNIYDMGGIADWPYEVVTD